jgi:hypothetical protein
MTAFLVVEPGVELVVDDGPVVTVIRGLDVPVEGK